MQDSAARIRRLRLALALVLVAVLGGSAPAGAASLPSGFSETVVFSGLVHPTAVQFASDGRIFVAEKSGLIKVFDNLSDTTPTTFADLRTNVHDFWDRGLLGLALHPGFPTTPYVYALYTYDAAIGGTAPRWRDACPTPPGPTTDGCVVSGRLSRLQAVGNVMSGEQVLIEDWCQQYPSHSIGDLAFGPDGALYVSGGEGASFTFTDYGQDGSPLNPCGDPPTGAGTALSPPTAEGGALRSQDLRTTTDPVTLDGAILRVDPNTGAGLAGNPLAGNPDPNARRIVAYGLRNPFRFTLRPGTSEIWIGDVGWRDWEEINRIVSPTDSLVENFGWPCYEGDGRQPGYDGANLNICEQLYGANAVTAPYFRYHHNDLVVPAEVCPRGGSSVTGVSFQFYSGGSYPPDYDGALFFADYTRDCIWAMQRSGSVLPSPSNIRTFVAGASNPVALEAGPGGDLFYVDFDGGTIRRVQFTQANTPPTAVVTASPTSGNPPLKVTFDGSGSSDPDPGDGLSYAWDLDGDGAFDDSTALKPTYTYTAAGVYTARLRVTDSSGASSTASVTITVGNTPPTATIATPSPTRTWAVGEQIQFSGSASDPQDGALPASALSWSLVLHHCPSTCHTHPLQEYPGLASGSFVTPEHDHPSHLELRLTATDSGGLSHTASVRLDPRTVTVTLKSSPGGLRLGLDSFTGTTPLTSTVIQGSSHTLIAPTPQTKGSRRYVFVSWSDGGAQTHNFTASASATYTATYRRG